MEIDERNEIVKKYMTCAEIAAKKFYKERKIPDALYADYEDILQEAYIGIIKSAEKIKQEGTAEAYMYIRARSEIFNAIREKCWKTRYTVMLEAKVENAVEQMKREGIENPTDKQIAEKIGESELKVKRTKKNNKISVSLDAMLEDDRADRNRNESMMGFEESPEQIAGERDELEHVQQWIRKKNRTFSEARQKNTGRAFFRGKNN